ARRASLRVLQSIRPGKKATRPPRNRGPPSPFGQTLTEYIWNWVVRLRFAAELIAIRLQGAVTNSPGQGRANAAPLPKGPGHCQEELAVGRIRTLPISLRTKRAAAKQRPARS